MIEQKYQYFCQTPGDIHEHMPTLRKYAEGKEVVEIGVRGIVSTWAFLAGKPKRLLSIDIKHPSEYGGDIFEVLDATIEAGIPFDFKLGDSLIVEIPQCDVLFIDTLHEYEQLSRELELHHDKVRENIIMHDTNLAGDTGMVRAVDEFLANHPEWTIGEKYDNCNGLTILQRA